MQIRAAYTATTHAYEDLTGRGLLPLHFDEFKRIRFDGSRMLKHAGFHEVALLRGWAFEFKHTLLFPTG
jgi:hypothetical protein